MDFIERDKLLDETPPILPAEGRTMREPVSCMDRLYNSLNSYRDPEGGGSWQHRNVHSHLTRLGAGTHWPMPEVIDRDTAAKTTKKWREEVYESWFQLDHLVRTRFDDIAYPIRSDKTISDETLLDVIEQAWEKTTSHPLIRDVFSGTTLPETSKSGYEAWADIFNGLVDKTEFPIPSYSLVPEEGHPDKFAALQSYVDRHKVAFHIPALNLEQLTDRPLLIMLLVRRTTETPPHFVRPDWNAMQIGRAGRLLATPFCDAAFMAFLRGRDWETENWATDDPHEQGYRWGAQTDDGHVPLDNDIQTQSSHLLGYGRFFQPHENNKDYWDFNTMIPQLNQQGLVFGWSDGLLVLQAQAALYRFCLELAKLAMEHCVESESVMLPLLPGWPSNPRGCRTEDIEAKFSRDVAELAARLAALPDNESGIKYFSYTPPSRGFGTRHGKYTAYEIEQWRRQSNSRIRIVGNAHANYHPALEDGEYQFGTLPVEPEQLSHCRLLRTRSERLWFYFKKRTWNVLSSPQRFIEMCRDGYDCHYGWIREEAGDKGNQGGILKHLVCDEFNAKKALANDIIRRGLRFLIFATEISYTINRLAQELMTAAFPMEWVNGEQCIPDKWVDVHPLRERRTQDAFLTLSMHLRWLSKILFTHLRSQGLIHGSRNCRPHCIRTAIPHKKVYTKNRDKHGHLRYRPLPRALMGDDRPQMSYDPSSTPEQSPASGVPAVEFGKLLRDVERGPPNDQYGIPGARATAMHILSRVDRLLQFQDADPCFGSGDLVHDSADIVCQLANICFDLEMPNPLASERHILNDTAAVEKYKGRKKTTSTLAALDEFKFEEFMPVTAVDNVRQLIGVRYSNNDETEITMREANTRLEVFRDELFAWLRKDKCFPDGLKARSTPEVEAQWKPKAMGMAGMQELGLKETDMLQLRCILGNITTEDPDLRPKPPTQPQPQPQQQPPPAAPSTPPPPSPPTIGDLQISSQPQVSPDEKTKTRLAVRRYILGRYENREETTLPDRYNIDNVAAGTVRGPQARVQLTNRDWGVVDDTFGSSGGQKGQIRWQHWETLLKHMGFAVLQQEGSKVRFQWTPKSRLPEPQQKSCVIHKQHVPGKGAHIEMFRVRDWCKDFANQLGITAEVIEQYYDRAGAGGSRQGGHALSVRPFSGLFPAETGEEGIWDDYASWQFKPRVPDPGEGKIEVPGMAGLKRLLEEESDEDDEEELPRKRMAPGLFDGLVKQEAEGEDDEQRYRRSPKRVRFA